MVLWTALLGAYLLGSIPSAYLLTRLITGEDIRRFGDGNVGAKNTFDSVSRAAGLAVGVLDIGKGLIAVSMASRLELPPGQIMLVGAAAVLGHDLPLYLRFRGGQGLAASVGTFLALFPREMLLAATLILLALIITRHWEWSLAAGFILMILLLLGGRPLFWTFYAVALLLSVAFRKLLAARRAGELPA